MALNTPSEGRNTRHAGEKIKEPLRAVPQSLTVQTFAIIREKINSGEWSGFLPSEGALCNWMVVSRGTLRKALSCLERDGLVKSRQGRRWQITPQPKPPQPPANKHVALLTPFSLNTVAPFEIYWIDSLRQHLQNAGYRLDVYQHLDFRGWRRNEVLEQLCREVRPAGWVLRSSPESVQQWFSERSLPCVIVGSRHCRVALPSLDRDLAAVCRHAVGRLAGNGHTRIALVIPGSGLAGDLACEKSFLDTAEKILKPRRGEATIIHHEGSPESIFHRLSSAMQHRPAPTGFLVTDTRYTLSALSFFQRSGLRVPHDVSVVSRDNDDFLEYVVPRIARYATNPTLFASSVSRMVLRLVEGGDVIARDHRVLPRFIPGETLGECHTAG